MQKKQTICFHTKCWIGYMVLPHILNTNQVLMSNKVNIKLAAFTLKNILSWVNLGAQVN